MIRALQTEDVAEVAALDEAIFGVHAWSWEAWMQEARSQGADRRYIVLLRDGLVAGYAGILRGGSDADVLSVAVSPEQRRRGSGRLLVAALLETAVRWRCLAVFLEVEEENAAARALYGDLGFAEIGQRRHYYGQNRHAVTMRRQLREPLGSQLWGGDEA